MNTPETKSDRLSTLLGGDETQLFIGTVPVRELARRFSTPCYVYNADVAVRQIRRVRQALGSTTALYYSLKANPSLGLCQVIAREGVGAEVASIGELLLAQAAGFPASKILFAGPGKTVEELELSAKMGIHAINVESIDEMKRLARIAARLGTDARIGLRLNPATPVKGAQMRMGGGPQQFGIDEEQLSEALDAARRRPHLNVVGLHVYAGTQMFDVEGLAAHCHHVLDLALKIVECRGHPLELIDFGGGFGVPYFENSPAFDLEAFTASYQSVVRRCQNDPRLAPAQLIIELGRYLVAEAGIYLTRVVDVKHSRGRVFVVTDGGMNHHIAATGNFGQVFRKPYPLALVNRRDAPYAQKTTIVGPCCTPLDVIAQEVPFPSVEVGDLIGIFYSGAYGYSASSLAFLSHPTPAEVMVWQGRTYLLRERGKPEQVLENQRRLDV